MLQNDFVVETPPGPGPKQPPTPAAPPMIYVHESPRWEYKIVARDANESLSEDDLNALGKDGWELSGVIALGAQVRFYFKRTK